MAAKAGEIRKLRYASSMAAQAQVPGTSDNSRAAEHALEPPRLPADLEAYRVTQDYSRYDAADQATWRFVMLHLMRHLSSRAHPLYLEGLSRSALAPVAIPRISDVDAALRAFGWRAIPVSGFLPPRAFQRLQALGILPIAADIRTPNHIAYTPAPDIIHEALGHAPLLADPVYAEYVKRAGAVAELAFSSPEDDQVHTAIAHLSALKEASPEGHSSVKRAEEQLQAALSRRRNTSEALRMSRLYWWTAEYGLIGTPKDFKLFGAGLLSSLAESLQCFEPRVRKLPLSVQCLDVAYDITTQQPQLFVVPSFDRLFDVLTDAERTLAANQGPLESAHAAWLSRSPAYFELSQGGEIAGTLRRYGTWQRRLAWMEIACQDASPQAANPKRYTLLLPLGIPEEPPSRAQLEALVERRARLRLRYPFGMTVEGELRAVTGNEYPLLEFEHAKVQHQGIQQVYARYLLPLFSNLRRARPSGDVSGAQQNTQVAPIARQFDADERQLRELYGQARDTWQHNQGPAAAAALGQIHDLLRAHHPDEWLLRWNLLERLRQLGELNHSAQLQRELELLEARYSRLYPIATGLRSLLTLSEAANDSVSRAS
jgi:phenylalanine-4-hydroxylase